MRFFVIYKDCKVATISDFHTVVEMHCTLLLYFCNCSTKGWFTLFANTQLVLFYSGTVLTGATYFLYFIFKTAWRFLTPVSVLKSVSYKAGTSSISTSREKSRILSSDKVKRRISKIYSNVLLWWQFVTDFVRRMYVEKFILKHKLIVKIKNWIAVVLSTPKQY